MIDCGDGPVGDFLDEDAAHRLLPLHPDDAPAPGVYACGCCESGCRLEWRGLVRPLRRKFAQKSCAGLHVYCFCWGGDFFFLFLLLLVLLLVLLVLLVLLLVLLLLLLLLLLLFLLLRLLGGLSFFRRG